LDGGPPGFPHEETFHVVLRDTSGSRIAFAYGAVTLSGGPFQAASANEPICNSLQESQLPLVGPTTPRLQRLRPITQPRFGLLRFRSPLLTECSLLLEVLRCFSSLGVLATVYVFNRASLDITPGGFPHSDISGSTLARNSPKHFAACHVLRRLLAPRHPPLALSSLTYSVHAASTVLARMTRCGRVGIDPRRNRCFHSSIGKVVSQAPRRAVMRTWSVSGLVTTIARMTNSGLHATVPRVYQRLSGRSTSRRGLVEMRGLEPLTPSLQRRCSPS
jgi:hypothetical protein